MSPLFYSKMRPWLRCGLACSIAFLLAACNSSPVDASAPGDGGPVGTKARDKADVGFLLTMTFDEAKKLSPQNLLVPPFYKIAADEITVLKRDAAGQPLRVRAKGHVFLQIDFRDQLQALGQEAYIASGGEIIMRGKPLLKRGRSVVEGLSDYTVFYIKALRLQVIGSHRLAKQDAPASNAIPGTPNSMPSWNVTPSWQRSWKDGPNPLLPALTPGDVPENMRASLLLPPPDADSDTPRPLPKGEPAPSMSPPTSSSASVKEKEKAPAPASSPPPVPEAPGSPSLKVPDLEEFLPAPPVPPKPKN